MERELPDDIGDLPAAGLAISVIVPVHNAKGDIPELVEALVGQTLVPSAYEIILVDDGSTDGSLSRLVDSPPSSPSEAIRPRLRVVRCPRRCGSYAARNRGLEAAVGANIAFTDADGRPEPGWLEAGLDALKTVPRVAGKVELVCSAAPSVFELVDAARFLRQRRYVREGFGATANLFVRREVFERIGPFDERLLSGGDHEFGQRATAAGIPIAYAAGSVVRHPCRRSFREIARKAFRVGFGFGQALGIGGKSTLRASLGRALDRIKLSTGRALKERSEAHIGLRLALQISLFILTLHLIALSAIPFGLTSMRRSSERGALAPGAAKIGRTARSPGTQVFS